MKFIGNPNAKWPVLLDELNDQSVIYAAGVGEDVSFDLGLIDQVGCDVHAFDPTPRACAYAEPIAAENPKFHFHPWGLWSSDTTMKFFAPANSEHVSHSILNLQEQDDFFEAPCRKVSTIMNDLGHTHIDLLKIDIEGAEYEVIDSLFKSDIFPRLVCIEFDQPYPYAKTVQFIQGTILQHYQVYCVDGWNFGFIRND